ncbi:hypothetical protein F4802DRAFT_601354 [Xylaria palmicola]|nr:hypothetical protein F4802DRAFT_601354 [Xylaria palmicola]
MISIRLTYLLALYTCALTLGHVASSHLLPTRSAFQFTEPRTWVENIAVRSNGDLLVTMLLPNASLYTLRRPYSATREVALVHTFQNASGLLGITETDTDTFAILSVRFTETLAAIPGSSTLWGLSLRRDRLRTWKIASLPHVQVPNGITAIPGTSAVLAADSSGGTVTRCDTRTGTCEVVLAARAETTPGTGDGREPTGINGIHYRGGDDGHVYWSNSNLASIFRTRVDRHGYLAANASADVQVQRVGRLDASFIDDFAIDDAGRFWVTVGHNNTVAALWRNGEVEVVAGSLADFAVAGCTAAAFGRTAHDSRTLYVVTNGALRAPVNGTTEPGKIVAIDTSAYR